MRARHAHQTINTSYLRKIHTAIVRFGWSLPDEKREHLIFGICMRYGCAITEQFRIGQLEKIANGMARFWIYGLHVESAKCGLAIVGANRYLNRLAGFVTISLRKDRVRQRVGRLSGGISVMRFADNLRGVLVAYAGRCAIWKGTTAQRQKAEKE